TDASLRTLGATARAPKPQVEAIAHKAEQPVTQLRALLASETAQANERGMPQSLEALVDELLPTSKKRTRYVKALFGLAEPFEGRVDISAREVAKHFDKTRTNIYLTVGALRD